MMVSESACNSVEDNNAKALYRNDKLIAAQNGAIGGMFSRSKFFTRHGMTLGLNQGVDLNSFELKMLK
jgi:hypothetical protein